jgi:hypothetical protein
MSIDLLHQYHVFVPIYWSLLAGFITQVWYSDYLFYCIVLRMMNMLLRFVMYATIGVFDSFFNPRTHSQFFNPFSFPYLFSWSLCCFSFPIFFFFFVKIYIYINGRESSLKYCVLGIFNYCCRNYFGFTSRLEQKNCRSRYSCRIDLTTLLLGCNATLTRYGGRSFSSVISFLFGTLCCLIFFGIDIGALRTPLPDTQNLIDGKRRKYIHMGIIHTIFINLVYFYFYFI